MSDWFSRDFSEWNTIAEGQTRCKHLWKQEPRHGNYFEDWAYVVSDDHDYYEFRQCVVCSAKQLREPPS